MGITLAVPPTSNHIFLVLSSEYLWNLPLPLHPSSPCLSLGAYGGTEPVHSALVSPVHQLLLHIPTGGSPAACRSPWPPWLVQVSSALDPPAMLACCADIAVCPLSDSSLSPEQGDIWASFPVWTFSPPCPVPQDLAETPQLRQGCLLASSGPCAGPVVTLLQCSVASSPSQDPAGAP